MDTLQALLHFETTISSTKLVLAVLAVAVLLTSCSWNRAIGSSANRDDLETRRGVPILGNLPEIASKRHALLEFFMQATSEQETKKPLTLTMPGRRLINCSKPEYLEFIQKTGFNNFAKGKDFWLNTQQVLGNGIFATDGARWKTQRQATAKIFSGQSFRGIITQSLDRGLESLLQIIRQHADSGEEFELDTLFFRFTLNTFSDMALGVDLGALNPADDTPVPFSAAFDTAQGILDARFTNPYWRITEALTGRASEMKAACKVIDDFAYGVIDEREKDEKKDDLNLLSLYMALRDENGQPLDRKALRDSVLNLISRDTLAQSLSWTVYRLLNSPEGPSSVEKMRTELAEMGKIDYDTFKSLTQVNAVFSEGLRLAPSVSKNLWVALEDVAIPEGGPFVKKGDYVFWSDFLMARDQEIWGEDAAEFKPSRWIDEEGQLKKESQFKMHAFNAGYRLCVGQELAKYEGAAVLAAIFREFDLEFASDYLATVTMMDTEEVPRYAASLTLPLLEPLRVRATRRKKA